MRPIVTTILASVGLAAGIGGVLWWSLRRRRRTVDGAIRFDTAVGILLGVGLASSFFIAYTSWFVSGLCIGLAVFVSQLIHAVTVKQVLQSEVANTQLLRLFLGSPSVATDDGQVESEPRSRLGRRQSRYECFPRY